ncbi:PP2C family protein-serine/threonine phosphatase [Carboxylicivirga marina]|uniref:SpoIIE family protein phosphatase n=1 Tax=Carboxylicivirga marina TaxID=2800988 RepID=A0ABS1HJC6_9BACT|nr:7TM diverse intracellular signaling domain-containing protein [Carboxylicivirga marina]MBK3517767.1 SpoIIE family protein phosphatase [Carboxylicivirga marina]
MRPVKGYIISSPITIYVLLIILLTSCDGLEKKSTFIDSADAVQIQDEFITYSEAIVGEEGELLKLANNDTITWKSLSEFAITEESVNLFLKVELTYHSSCIVNLKGAQIIELVELQDSIIIKRKNAGVLAENQRLYRYKDKPWVILDAATGDKSTIYASVEYGRGIKKPIVYLYDEQVVFDKLLVKKFIEGVLIGALVILLIINLIFLISTRDKVYFPYLLYVASFTLLFLLRESIIYEIISSIWLPRFIDALLFITTGMLIISYLWFASRYLHLKTKQSYWYKIVRLSMVGTIVIVALIYVLRLVAHSSSTIPVTIWSVGIFLLINIPAWKRLRFYKPAFLLLLSNIILSLGGIVNLLIGIQTNSMLVNHALEIAVVLQMVIFSKGIGDRVKLEMQEKHRAQKDAMRMLEAKVVERTAEVTMQKGIVEKKNRSIIDSLNYAHHIQAAILPPAKLLKDTLGECFVLYKPKTIVAGDFYWMEKVNGRVFFAVADCTGHGVPGALLSVMCSNILSRAVKEMQLYQPSTILDAAVNLLEGYFEKSTKEVKDGMDLALCCLHSDSRLLEYAGANNPLYLVRNDELVEFKPNRQPVGKYRKRQLFNNHVIELRKGDCVYLSSDGYADQFGGENGTKYRYNRFKDSLISIHTLEMNKQENWLNETIEDWKGDNDQIDDICVMGLRMT